MIVSGDTAFQTCQLRGFVEVEAREGIYIWEGLEELKRVRLDAERDSPGRSKGNTKTIFLDERNGYLCPASCSFQKLTQKMLNNAGLLWGRFITLKHSLIRGV